jgi:hypothetical protein
MSRQRWYNRSLRTTLVGLLVTSFVSGVTERTAVGQQVVDLDRFDECKRCDSELALEALLGDARGAGIIEHANVRVVFDEVRRRFAVYTRTGSKVQLFDSTGKFITALGRRGGGPGEIKRIYGVGFMDGRIVVLDAGGPKLLLLTEAGRILHETRLDVRPGWIRVVRPGTLVVASMDQRPAAVGLPLHLVDVSTGQPVAHFGSIDGRWSAADPFASVITLGESPRAQTVWRGYLGQYRFEEWDLKGDLLRVVTGNPDWFRSPVTGRTERPSLVAGFAIDEDERLWVVTRTADPDWERVPGGGGEGLISEADFDHAFDSRLDVFDLRRGVHLATHVWDEFGVHLTRKDGSVLVHAVKLDDTSVPRVALYTLVLSDNE